MIPLQRWGYQYLDLKDSNWGDQKDDGEQKENNWKKVCARTQAMKTRDRQKSCHLCGRYKRVAWPKEHKFWLIWSAVRSNISAAIAVSHWAIAYINGFKKTFNAVIWLFDLAGHWLIPWHSRTLRNCHLFFSLFIIWFPLPRYMYMMVKISFLGKKDEVQNSKKDEYKI